MSCVDGSMHGGLDIDDAEGPRMGGRFSSYDMNDQIGFGSSEQGMGYGNPQKGRRSYYSQRGWGGGPSGGYRGSVGAPTGGRGHAHPPPLLSPMPFSEMSGLRAFTGNFYFGGGFKQKTKRMNKDRTGQRKMLKDEGPPSEKKGKPTIATEDTEEVESDGDGDALNSGKSTKNDGDDKETDDKEAGNKEKSTEETESSEKRQQEIQKKRLRDRIVERIQFICSLCKFRTFYKEEMSNHLQSDFHEDHFRYIGSRLPKQEADFLEEYVKHKAKKTEERRNIVEDLSTTIHQIYRDQDLTQGLGVEHFVKKVEAAHCAACDIFIPMHPFSLKRHLQSSLHNQNRRNMMDQSKKSALAVARTILNNKHIGQKLQRYIKGENPFADSEESECATTQIKAEDQSALDTPESDSTFPATEGDAPHQSDTQSTSGPLIPEEQPSTMENFLPEES
ncbi:hypothetical protein GDO86_006832 [Hymenochirus boettgeri]|uniref:C2H2 AKAP95-type domain-containing protein n=1 Tax=Hymenochirus boettgeri TaxID=247094 RepID=A0A8T2JCK6_9PIPI|nr:hypothetical protein GDO86_006832 [Hymenochirus boettgeri]